MSFQYLTIFGPIHLSGADFVDFGMVYPRPFFLMLNENLRDRGTPVSINLDFATDGGYASILWVWGKKTAYRQLDEKSKIVISSLHRSCAVFLECS